jgi:hypothetical protein
MKLFYWRIVGERELSGCCSFLYLVAQQFEREDKTFGYLGVVRHFMKHSVYTIIILTFTLFSSCNTTEKKIVIQNNTIPKVDTFAFVKQTEIVIQEADSYDSLANAKIDTTTLKGKREFIMNHFLIENRPSSPDCDTLFDLNYDGEKDYVICYYGQAGNGIKNRIQVFLYNKKFNGYIYNEQLSALPNPSFYIKQKKITSFYIAGHGSGRRLEWINGKWTQTKVFEVDNQEPETVWEIEYPLTKKKEKIRHPFQMIPPKEILETDIKI